MSRTSADGGCVVREWQAIPRNSKFWRNFWKICLWLERKLQMWGETFDAFFFDNIKNPDVFAKLSVAQIKSWIALSSLAVVQYRYRHEGRSQAGTKGRQLEVTYFHLKILAGKVFNQITSTYLSFSGQVLYLIPLSGRVSFTICFLCFLIFCLCFLIFFLGFLICVSSFTMSSVSFTVFLVCFFSFSNSSFPASHLQFSFCVSDVVDFQYRHYLSFLPLLTITK